MSRPTALFASLGALVASLCLVVPSPAQAATVVDVDTTTPGHVTGTATTDAPFAYVMLVDNGVQMGGQVTSIVSGGEVTFDKETWGLRTDRTYSLRVGACADNTFDHCVPTDTPFTPNDVDPSVTWPADRAIGPGETTTVALTDAGGGGWVSAKWSPWQSERLYSGDNTWWMPDGAQTVSIQRCSVLGCRDTGQTASFFIDRAFEPREAAGGSASVRPDDTTAADATVMFGLEAPEPVTLEWHLVDPDSGATVPGVGGVVSGIVPEVDAATAFPLDLTGAPDGRYRLVGVMSYDSDDFGHRTADVTHDYIPVVDRVAPTISNLSVSIRNYFPISDGYQDDFEIGFDVSEGGTQTYEFLNGAGAVVYHDDRAAYGGYVHGNWYGKDQAGNRVPAGTYTMRVRLTDDAGNSSTIPLGNVTISWKRLVSDRVTKRVTATASEVDRWTGKCSSIVKGGSRRLKGGLGLMSNTKCSGGRAWARSGVVTVHAIRAPLGWRSGIVSVDPVGGAARSAPRSGAVLEYFSRSRKWVESAGLGSRFGLQSTGWVDSDRVVKDGWVVWRVATANGYRYDVQSFKVTFEGNFLR